MISRRVVRLFAPTPAGTRSADTPEDHDFGHYYLYTFPVVAKARMSPPRGPGSRRYPDHAAFLFLYALMMAFYVASRYTWRKKMWSWDRICNTDTLGSTSLRRDGVSVDVCGRLAWRPPVLGRGGKETRAFCRSRAAPTITSMFLTAVYTFGTGNEPASNGIFYTSHDSRYLVWTNIHPIRLAEVPICRHLRS